MTFPTDEVQPHKFTPYTMLRVDRCMQCDRLGTDSIHHQEPTDPLRGVVNRAGLLAKLEELLELAKAYTAAPTPEATKAINEWIATNEPVIAKLREASRG